MLGADLRLSAVSLVQQPLHASIFNQILGQHIQLFGMVAEWACGGCHSKENISSYPTLTELELLQASGIPFISCLVQDVVCVLGSVVQWAFSLVWSSTIMLSYKMVTNL